VELAGDERGRKVERKGRVGAAWIGRDPARERETVFRPHAGTRQRGVGLPPLSWCLFKFCLIPRMIPAFYPGSVTPNRGLTYLN
jgi:hypothetical protein